MLTTPDRVAKSGNFFEREDLDYLIYPIERAKIVLRYWVGDRNYNLALSGAPTPPATSGTEIYETLREAETLLAISEALQSLNRADTGRGITKTIGSSSADGSKTTQFLSADELEKEIKLLRVRAWELCRKYLIVENGVNTIYKQDRNG